ncbi:MAG TPA: chemotaxis protein CheB, partial [Nitrosospira sp.]|nr:chemotaxis protein CheB [Nitrosospira sp.]
MTRSDEKKSPLDSSRLSDSSFTTSELPDAYPIEDRCIDSESPSFPIIGVGASAGGVEALQILCRSLLSSTDAAYIVAVHLAPDHKSQLANILAKSTSMKVVQVVSDITVEPGTVYVISPNHYLLLIAGTLRLELMPQPRPLPRAIDRLFISLAEE